MSQRSKVREVLNAPTVVSTSIGTIKIKKMSIVDTIETLDTIVAIASKVWDEMKGQSMRLSELGRGGDPQANLRAIGTIAKIAARDMLDLLEPSTGKRSEELQNLEIDEMFDVMIAFVDVHERSISRFFDLRARVQALVPATEGRTPLSTPSTTSSPTDGSSTPSEPSRTTRSSTSTAQPIGKN